MTTLAGRESELASIARFLESIPRGFGALVLSGEPGSGKTALLEELVREAFDSGARVLRADASEAEADLPFAVLADLLDGVETGGLDLPPPQARALELALRRREPDGRPADPLAVGLALRAVLRALATAAPLLVAIDDLQWADVPSHRALDFASRGLGPAPVGLAVAARADGPRPSLEPAVRVEVGPLAEEPFGAVLRRATGLPLGRSFVRRMHRACAGNPLFGIEVALAACSGGAPPGPKDPIQIPDSVAAAVQRRVAALEAPVRDFLLHAAALARPTLTVLRRASGSADVDAELNAAVGAGLVTVADDLIRFTHPLFADALYASAPPGRRRAAHRRLASALDDVAERALHLALAATRPDADIAAALESAAADARERGAPDAAAALLEQAAASTPSAHGVERRRRLLEAGRLYLADGETARARTVLTDLAQAAPAGRERAAVLLELARACEDDLRTALEKARAGLLEAAGDPSLEVGLRHLMIGLHFGLGDAAAATGEAYVALAAARRTGSESLIATAICRVASVDLWQGRPVRIEELEHAAEVHRLPGQAAPTLSASATVTLAEYCKRVGDYVRARALHLADLEDALKRGDERGRARMLEGLADVELRAGNLQVARRYADDVRELGRQLGDQGYEAYGRLRAGTALALLGELDAAEAEVLEGRAISIACGIEPYIGWSEHGLGMVALGRDDPARALELFRSCDARADAAGVADPGYRQLPLAIEALVALGRHDEAAAAVSDVERRCSPALHARVLALTARYRGLLASLAGEHAAAEELFAESLAVGLRAPSPYDRARTLLALATARRRARRRGDARTALREAIELFEATGAAAWAARARTELAGLGLRRVQDDRLTPMEDRVARLVATGATNREAAAALFVSPKTIEFHLGSVYRKLGLRSRAQLSEALASMPSVDHEAAAQLSA